MKLGELIAHLKRLPPDHPVAAGFARACSYRGDYAQVAFQPMANTTAGAMLACAEDAVGTEFFGYKGGRYTMSEYSEVFIAHLGETTDGPLDEVALDRMLYPGRFATAKPGALSSGEMAIWAAAYVAALAQYPQRLDKACSIADSAVEQLRGYVATVAPEGRGMAGEMVSAASQ